MTTNSFKGKNAILIGGSSGIGKAQLYDKYASLSRQAKKNHLHITCYF